MGVSPVRKDVAYFVTASKSCKIIYARLVPSSATEELPTDFVFVLVVGTEVVVVVVNSVLEYLNFVTCLE